MCPIRQSLLFLNSVLFNGLRLNFNLWLAKAEYIPKTNVTMKFIQFNLATDSTIVQNPFINLGFNKKTIYIYHMLILLRKY